MDRWDFRKLAPYLLFFGALVVRLLLHRYGTYQLDQNTFIAWSNILVNGPLSEFYQNAWCDYLPGYLYVLWVLAKVKTFVSIDPTLLYKIPGILGDVFGGILIYKIVSGLKNKKWGLIASTAYLFNPAIIGNSTLWGQVDSLTILFALSAVHLVSKRPHLSAVLLAVGTAIKPQAAFVVPVVAYYMWKMDWKLKRILTYGLVSLTVFMLLFLPFSGSQNPFVFTWERIMTTLNQYPFGSVNAFNTWGLLGFWRRDDVGLLSSKLMGYILSGILIIVSTVFIDRKKTSLENKMYILTAVIFATTFMFLTRMHERHLLPLFMPLVIIAVTSPISRLVYLGFSLTYLANLGYAYNYISPDHALVISDSSSKLVIIANMVLYLTLFYSLLKEKIRIGVGSIKTGISALPKINLSKNREKVLILLIIIFAFSTRVYSLGSPKEEYFDEVYHAFTARRMLNNDPKAWEWWNTPPAGFAYEWTHPPIAKLGMVVGMSIFGENSFGWRIPGAILGTISVYLIYLIAKNIFRDGAVGLLSAATFTLDGMGLTISRIGMNDAYLLFFILSSLYFFIKGKNFFSAVAFGLAISSKWSAIWFVPVLILFQKVVVKKLTPTLAWFLVIPPAIYLASYIPMFLTGHNWGNFIEVQKQMWWYHTNLVATHAYSSSWWSWPMMLRPVYLYTSNEIGGLVSRIYLMGNPAVFWGGVVSALSLLYLSYKEKNKKLALIVFSYLMFFVPWAASPRIMFLYHYFPAVALMAITLGYYLRRYPKTIPYFLVISGLLFVYFFPHWIGMEIPLALDKSYYWLTSWR